MRLLVNGEDQGLGFAGLHGHGELIPVVWLFGHHDSLEALHYRGPLALTSPPEDEQAAATHEGGAAEGSAPSSGAATANRIITAGEAGHLLAARFDPWSYGQATSTRATSQVPDTLTTSLFGKLLLHDKHPGPPPTLALQPGLAARGLSFSPVSLLAANHLKDAPSVSMSLGQQEAWQSACAAPGINARGCPPAMHSWEIEIKASGGRDAANKGYFCVGLIEMAGPALNMRATKKASLNTLMGAAENTRGWGLLSNGALWWSNSENNGGQRLSNGYASPLRSGDVITVNLDLEGSGTLSFAINGHSLGPAFGPLGSGASVILSPKWWLPPKQSSSLTGDSDGSGSSEKMEMKSGKSKVVRLFPAVSLYAPGPRLAVRGINNSINSRNSSSGSPGVRLELSEPGWATRQPPLLLDLVKSCAVLGGKLACGLVAGRPVLPLEQSLAPWLDSPLLAGGLSTSANQTMSESSCSALGDDPSATPGLVPASTKVSSFADTLRWPRDDGDTKQGNAAPASGVTMNALPSDEKDPNDLTVAALLQGDDVQLLDPGSGPSLCVWLDQQRPDRWRQVKIQRAKLPAKHSACWSKVKEAAEQASPQARRERSLFAAMTKHARLDPLVRHLADSLRASAAEANTAAGAVRASDYAPLLEIWGGVQSMRLWVYDRRQAYEKLLADDEERRLAAQAAQLDSSGGAEAEGVVGATSEGEGSSSTAPTASGNDDSGDAASTAPAAAAASAAPASAPASSNEATQDLSVDKVIDHAALLSDTRRIVPLCFREVEAQLDARIAFALALEPSYFHKASTAPAASSPSTNAPLSQDGDTATPKISAAVEEDEGNDESYEEEEIDEDGDEAPAAAPALGRTLSALHGSPGSKKKAEAAQFGRVLGVLRAQQAWRASKGLVDEYEDGENDSLAFAPNSASNKDGPEELETEVESSSSAKSNPAASPWKPQARVLPPAQRAAAWACLLYATDGTMAPPSLLAKCCRRRSRRALERAFGLRALSALLNATPSHPSARLDALVHFRAALRGEGPLELLALPPRPPTNVLVVNGLPSEGSLLSAAGAGAAAATPQQPGAAAAPVTPGANLPTPQDGGSGGRGAGRTSPSPLSAARGHRDPNWTPPTGHSLVTPGGLQAQQQQPQGAAAAQGDGGGNSSAGNASNGSSSSMPAGVAAALQVHHPLRGLEAAGRGPTARVRAAAAHLIYSSLAPGLSDALASCDGPTAATYASCLAWDWKPGDAEDGDSLAQALVPSVQQAVGAVSSVRRGRKLLERHRFRAHQLAALQAPSLFKEAGSTPEPADSAPAVASLPDALLPLQGGSGSSSMAVSGGWVPWSRREVARALKSGRLSKRRLLDHMWCAPRVAAPPSQWWIEHGVSPNEERHSSEGSAAAANESALVSCCSQHSKSSLEAVHASFLDHLVERASVATTAAPSTEDVTAEDVDLVKKAIKEAKSSSSVDTPQVGSSRRKSLPLHLHLGRGTRTYLLLPLRVPTSLAPSAASLSTTSLSSAAPQKGMTLELWLRPHELPSSDNAVLTLPTGFTSDVDFSLGVAVVLKGSRLQLLCSGDSESTSSSGTEGTKKEVKWARPSNEAEQRAGLVRARQWTHAAVVVRHETRQPTVAEAEAIAQHAAAKEAAAAAAAAQEVAATSKPATAPSSSEPASSHSLTSAAAASEALTSTTTTTAGSSNRAVDAHLVSALDGLESLRGRLAALDPVASDHPEQLAALEAEMAVQAQMVERFEQLQGTAYEPLHEEGDDSNQVAEVAAAVDAVPSGALDETNLFVSPAMQDQIDEPYEPPTRGSVAAEFASSTAAAAGAPPSADAAANTVAVDIPAEHDTTVSGAALQNLFQEPDEDEDETAKNPPTPSLPELPELRQTVVSLVVNGAVAASSVVRGHTPLCPVQASGETATLDVGSGVGFTGRVAHVKWWSRPLTIEELAVTETKKRVPPSSSVENAAEAQAEDKAAAAAAAQAVVSASAPSTAPQVEEPPASTAAAAAPSTGMRTFTPEELEAMTEEEQEELAMQMAMEHMVLDQATPAAPDVTTPDEPNELPVLPPPAPEPANPEALVDSALPAPPPASLEPPSSSLGVGPYPGLVGYWPLEDENLEAIRGVGALPGTVEGAYKWQPTESPLDMDGGEEDSNTALEATNHQAVVDKLTASTASFSLLSPDAAPVAYPAVARLVAEGAMKSAFLDGNDDLGAGECATVAEQLLALIASLAADPLAATGGSRRAAETEVGVLALVAHTKKSLEVASQLAAKLVLSAPAPNDKDDSDMGAESSHEKLLAVAVLPEAAHKAAEGEPEPTAEVATRTARSLQDLQIDALSVESSSDATTIGIQLPSSAHGAVALPRRRQGNRRCTLALRRALRLAVNKEASVAWSALVAFLGNSSTARNQKSLRDVPKEDVPKVEEDASLAAIELRRSNTAPSQSPLRRTSAQGSVFGTSPAEEGALTNITAAGTDGDGSHMGTVFSKPALEASEAEHLLHAFLLRCLSLGGRSDAVIHWARSKVGLITLCDLTNQGSPRLRRLSLMLLTRYAPQCSPVHLAAALPENSLLPESSPRLHSSGSPSHRGSLAQWLLGPLGHLAMLGLENEVEEKSTSVDSASSAAWAHGSGASSWRLAGPRGLGTARRASAHAHQVVGLTHALLSSSPTRAFEPHLVPALRDALGTACRMLIATSDQSRSSSSGEAPQGGDFSEDAACALAGVLAVLGGLQPSLRVGGCVALNPRLDASLSRAATAAAAPEAPGWPGKVLATLVAWRRGDLHALVAFPMPDTEFDNLAGGNGGASGPLPVLTHRVPVGALVAVGSSLPVCLLRDDNLCSLFMRTCKLLKQRLDHALGEASSMPSGSASTRAMGATDSGSEDDDDDDVAPGFSLSAALAASVSDAPTAAPATATAAARAVASPTSSNSAASTAGLASDEALGDESEAKSYQIGGMAEKVGLSGLRLARLWVLALRSFPQLLGGRGPQVSSSPDLVDLLYGASLKPVAAPGFLACTALERRAILVQERLGDALSLQLNHDNDAADALAQTADDGEDEAAAERAAVAAAKAAAKLEERQATALNLMEFGGGAYDLSLCVKALELNGDDMERAMNWLFSDEAFGFMDGSSGGSSAAGGMGASGSGGASGVGGAGSGPGGVGGMGADEDPKIAQRWAVAETLVGIFQQPPKLCFHALEMFNDDAQHAAAWLGTDSGGRAYYKLMMAEDKAEVKVEPWPPSSAGLGDCAPVGLQSGGGTGNSAGGHDRHLMNDAMFTASSCWPVPEHAAHCGRLHYPKGAWVPELIAPQQWLQIDLGGERVLAGVATQGAERRYCSEQEPPEAQAAAASTVCYATSYAVETSSDGVTWKRQRQAAEVGNQQNGSLGRGGDVFTGNSDGSTVVSHAFADGVVARYVRFLPLAGAPDGMIAMRVEVFGEPVGVPMLALSPNPEAPPLPPSHFTASSGTAPSLARFQDLSVSDGWQASESDAAPWLEVDLGQPLPVTAVAFRCTVTDTWGVMVEHTMNDPGDDVVIDHAGGVGVGHSVWAQMHECQHLTGNGTPGGATLLTSRTSGKGVTVARRLKFHLVKLPNSTSGSEEVSRVDVLAPPAPKPSLQVEVYVDGEARGAALAGPLMDSAWSSTSCFDEQHDVTQARFSGALSIPSLVVPSAVPAISSVLQELPDHSSSGLPQVASRSAGGATATEATVASAPHEDRAITTHGNGWLPARMGDGSEEHLEIDLGTVCSLTGIAATGPAQQASTSSAMTTSNPASATTAAAVSRLELSVSQDRVRWSVPVACAVSALAAAQGKLVVRSLPAGGVVWPDAADTNTSASSNSQGSDWTARYLRVRPIEWASAPRPSLASAPDQGGAGSNTSLQPSSYLGLRVEVFGKSCGPPLGLQSEAIGHDQLSASSFTPKGPPFCGRLGGAAAWRPDPDACRTSSSSSPQCFTVKLKGRALLTGICTSGAAAESADCGAGWPAAYRLEVADDLPGSASSISGGGPVSWRNIGHFEGNDGPSCTRAHVVRGSDHNPVACKLVRVVVTKWGSDVDERAPNWAPALKLELYGYGVEEPAGLGTGAVSDHQLTASSVGYSSSAPRLGRLNQSNAGWTAAPTDTEPWLQVDLKAIRTVVGVATQGRPPAVPHLLEAPPPPGSPLRASTFVKAFSIEHSTDGVIWQPVRHAGLSCGAAATAGASNAAAVFRGNVDGSSVVTQYLPSPTICRFVRIKPKAWSGACSVRLEVYCAARPTAAAEDDEAALEDADTAGEGRAPLLLESSAEDAAAVSAAAAATVDAGAAVSAAAAAAVGSGAAAAAATGGGGGGPGSANVDAEATLVPVAVVSDEDLTTAQRLRNGGEQRPVLPRPGMLVHVVGPHGDYTLPRDAAWAAEMHSRAPIIAPAAASGPSSGMVPHAPGRRGRILQVSDDGQAAWVSLERCAAADADPAVRPPPWCFGLNIAGSASGSIGLPRRQSDGSSSGGSSSAISSLIAAAPTLSSGRSASSSSSEGGTAFDLEDEVVRVPLAELRAVGATVGGYTLKGVNDVRSLGFATDRALATHYARSALLSLVGEWRQHAKSAMRQASRSSSSDSAPSTGSTSELLLQAPDAVVALRRSFSSGGGRERATHDGSAGAGEGGVVGDVGRLVSLVKLVAATEGALEMSGSGDISSGGADDDNDDNGEFEINSTSVGGVSTTTSSSRIVEGTAGGSSGSLGGAAGKVALIRGVLQALLRVEAREASSTMGATSSLSLSTCAPSSPRSKQESATALAPTLASLLVNECVWHFGESTKPSDGRRVLMRESLHPYYPECDYAGEVRCAGATALRVHFDPRCRTHETGSVLLLSLDKAGLQVIGRFSGGPAKFRPVLVHGDRFFYRFRSRMPAASSSSTPYLGWGYRFSATPLLGLRWLREQQVVRHESSLEWACWLLDLLLTHAQKGLLPNGAVHNSKVFAALVRYMRSGGVPYKHRVIGLLTRLLQHPRCFAPADPPPLPLLAGVAELVREHCDRPADAAVAAAAAAEAAAADGTRASRAAAAAAAAAAAEAARAGTLDGASLPPRLQSLVELVAAAQLADREMHRLRNLPSPLPPPTAIHLPAASASLAVSAPSDPAAASAAVSATQHIETLEPQTAMVPTVNIAPHPDASVVSAAAASVLLPTPLDRQPVMDVLMDVLDAASALLDPTRQELPPPLVAEAFWRAMGCSIVVDGDLLAQQSESESGDLSGKLRFAGARELHVRLLAADEASVSSEGADSGPSGGGGGGDGALGSGGVDAGENDDDEWRDFISMDETARGEPMEEDDDDDEEDDEDDVGEDDEEDEMLRFLRRARQAGGLPMPMGGGGGGGAAAAVSFGLEPPDDPAVAAGLRTGTSGGGGNGGSGSTDNNASGSSDARFSGYVRALAAEGAQLELECMLGESADILEANAADLTPPSAEELEAEEAKDAAEDAAQLAREMEEEESKVEDAAQEEKTSDESINNLLQQPAATPPLSSSSASSLRAISPVSPSSLLQYQQQHSSPRNASIVDRIRQRSVSDGPSGSGGGSGMSPSRRMRQQQLLGLAMVRNAEASPAEAGEEAGTAETIAGDANHLPRLDDVQSVIQALVDRDDHEAAQLVAQISAASNPDAATRSEMRRATLLAARSDAAAEGATHAGSLRQNVSELRHLIQESLSSDSQEVRTSVQSLLDNSLGLNGGGRPITSAAAAAAVEPQVITLDNPAPTSDSTPSSVSSHLARINAAAAAAGAVEPQVTTLGNPAPTSDSTPSSVSSHLARINAAAAQASEGAEAASSAAERIATMLARQPDGSLSDAEDVANLVAQLAALNAQTTMSPLADATTTVGSPTGAATGAVAASTQASAGRAQPEADVDSFMGYVAPSAADIMAGGPGDGVTSGGYIAPDAADVVSGLFQGDDRGDTSALAESSGHADSTSSANTRVDDEAMSRETGRAQAVSGDGDVPHEGASSDEEAPGEGSQGDESSSHESYDDDEAAAIAMSLSAQPTWVTEASAVVSEDIDRDPEDGEDDEDDDDEEDEESDENEEEETESDEDEEDAEEEAWVLNELMMSESGEYEGGDGDEMEVAMHAEGRGGNRDEHNDEGASSDSGDAANMAQTLAESRQTFEGANAEASLEDSSNNNSNPGGGGGGTEEEEEPVNPQALEEMLLMGIDHDAAELGLQLHSSNVELAINFVFNHTEDMPNLLHARDEARRARAQAAASRAAAVTAAATSTSPAAVITAPLSRAAAEAQEVTSTSSAAASEEVPSAPLPEATRATESVQVASAATSDGTPSAGEAFFLGDAIIRNSMSAIEGRRQERRMAFRVPPSLTATQRSASRDETSVERMASEREQIQYEEDMLAIETREAHSRRALRASDQPSSFESNRESTRSVASSRSSREEEGSGGGSSGSSSGIRAAAEVAIGENSEASGSGGSTVTRQSLSADIARLLALTSEVSHFGQPLTEEQEAAMADIRQALSQFDVSQENFSAAELAQLADMVQGIQRQLNPQGAQGGEASSGEGGSGGGAGHGASTPAEGDWQPSEGLLPIGRQQQPVGRETDATTPAAAAAAAGSGDSEAAPSAAPSAESAALVRARAARAALQQVIQDTAAATFASTGRLEELQASSEEVGRGSSIFGTDTRMAGIARNRDRFNTSNPNPTPNTMRRRRLHVRANATTADASTADGGGDVSGSSGRNASGGSSTDATSGASRGGGSGAGARAADEAGSAVVPAVSAAAAKKAVRRLARLQAKLGGVAAAVVLAPGLRISLCGDRGQPTMRTKLSAPLVVKSSGGGSVGIAESINALGSDNAIFTLRRHPASDRLVAEATAAAAGAAEGSNTAADELESLPPQPRVLFLLVAGAPGAPYLCRSSDGSVMLTHDANDEKAAFALFPNKDGSAIMLATPGCLGRPSSSSSSAVASSGSSSTTSTALRVHDSTGHLLESQASTADVLLDKDENPSNNAWFKVMVRTSLPAEQQQQPPKNGYEFVPSKVTTCTPGRPLGCSSPNGLSLASAAAFRVADTQLQASSSHSHPGLPPGRWGAAAGRVRWPLPRSSSSAATVGGGGHQLLDSGSTGGALVGAPGDPAANVGSPDRAPGAWLAAAKDSAQHLTVDLLHLTVVAGFAVQAPYGENMRTKAFKVEFSGDGELWATLQAAQGRSSEASDSNKDNSAATAAVVLPGNCDNVHVACFTLNRAVKCRYVRFRPTEWHGAIALRVELFGPQKYRFVNGGASSPSQAAGGGAGAEAAATLRLPARPPKGGPPLVVPGDSLRYEFSAPSSRAQATQEEDTAVVKEGEAHPAGDVEAVAAATSEMEALAENASAAATTTAGAERKRESSPVAPDSCSGGGRVHYRFQVTAVGLPREAIEQWLSKNLGPDLVRAASLLQAWPAEADTELVAWAHARSSAMRSGMDHHGAAALSPLDLRPLSSRERASFPRLDPSRVPRWESLRAPTCDTMLTPIRHSRSTSVCAAAEEPVRGDDQAANEASSVAAVATKEEVVRHGWSPVRVDLLRIRLAFLQGLNARLRRCLPFVDLSAGAPHRTGYKLRALGHVVFYNLKAELLEASLRATSARFTSNSQVRAVGLHLDHAKKTMSQDKGTREPANSQCVFAQAFHQASRVSGNQVYRQADRIFSVSFVGEAGIDAGGVSREALTEMVGDLHAPDFNLFVLCPNGVHKVGTNLDKYLPNSGATSPLAISMFEFVGKLMGVSLRTKATLPFNFPSLVWKAVLGGTYTGPSSLSSDGSGSGGGGGSRSTSGSVHALDVSDLEAVDHVTVQTLRTLRAVTSPEDFATVLPGDDDDDDYATGGGGGADAASSSSGGGGPFFTTPPSNGLGPAVEVEPGGASRRVNFENRGVYCDAVEKFRLRELDRQLAAMRRGLGCVVPLSLLQLFTWKQVEELIAGKPDVDVEDLQRHTEYRGYTPHSPVVRAFWKSMEMLSPEERSNFVRFVWGRSRLPLKGQPWPQTFKIQRCSGGDAMLPTTHTCFFSIELPEYSSEAVCHQRLLTAITYGVGGILNG